MRACGCCSPPVGRGPHPARQRDQQKQRPVLRPTKWTINSVTLTYDLPTQRQHLLPAIIAIANSINVGQAHLSTTHPAGRPVVEHLLQASTLDDLCAAIGRLLAALGPPCALQATPDALPRIRATMEHVGVHYADP